MKCHIKFIMLAALVCALAAIGAANEAAAEVWGDLVYSVNADGTSCTVTGYTGEDYYTTVPEIINGYRVTRIGAGAFAECRNLTIINLPLSLTSIGDAIFMEENELGPVEVFYPGTEEKWNQIEISEENGVLTYTSIYFRQTYEPGSGRWLSYTLNSDRVSCTVTGYTGHEMNLIIPSALDGYTVTGIGDNALAMNEILTRVVMPDTVTFIGENAFSDDYRMTDIAIPEAVTAIGDYAFSNCSSLTNVTVPKNVSSLGYRVFVGCRNLQAIYVDEDNANYRSVRGVLYSKDLKTLIKCPEAFEGSLEIPAEVTQIEYYAALLDCERITSFNVAGGNNKYYSVDGVLFDRSNAALIGCPRGKQGSYSIPDGVTAIYEFAFFHCAGLSGISFPESLTDIGESAFSYCTGLTQITIPGSVSTIGYASFNNCSGLTSVIIQDGVTSILSLAFDSCTGLRSIAIPGSVKHIGDLAFFGCDSLTEIILLEGVETIEQAVFAGCPNLTTVTLSAGITSIDKTSFHECPSLTQINVSEDNPVYSSVRGVLYDKGAATLIYCPAGKQGVYEIPEGVATIEQQAFYQSSLSGISIPASVTNIEQYAFYKCDDLTAFSVSSGNRSYCSIQGVLFSRDPKVLIRCPSAMTGEYTIPDGTAGIGVMAFGKCALTGITMPDSVTYISDDAFSDCQNLANVALSHNLTSIGRYSFAGCGSLTKVSIPYGVMRIEASAFNSCYSLEEAAIPDSVTSIGESAFNNCYRLAEIVIPDGVTDIGIFAFSSCSALKTITLPRGLKSIAMHAFSYCRSLESISIPEGVTTIDAHAFQVCSSLKTLTLPNGLTSVGSWSFTNCKNLKTVVIPASVTVIGDGVFSGCSGLTDIYFLGTEDEWDQIAIGETDSCFNRAVIHFGDPFPRALVLPADTVSIESEAFAGLTNADAIEIPRTVESIAEDAFSGSSVTLIVPAGSYAEAWAIEHHMEYTVR